MSITVDDSGIPIPDPDEHPVPLALSWLQLWNHHHTKYPDLAAEQDAENLTDALARFSADAASSGVPAAYLRALRTGTPDTRYHITVAGHPVSVVLADPPQPPINPARERDSWIELRHAVAAANEVDCDGIHPGLPRELALAVWEHNGREIIACRPGTPRNALRRARERFRRRLTALSPLPLLGTLTQPLAGSATAVGIAIAPIPPIHAPAPPSPAVREMTGEIDRPKLPWLAGAHIHPGGHLLAAPPVPALPSPDSAAPDSAATAPPTEAAAPAPAPSAASPEPTPAESAPAAPEPQPTTSQTVAADEPTTVVEPTVSPSAEPSPVTNAARTGRAKKRAHGHGKANRPHPLRRLHRGH